MGLGDALHARYRCGLLFDGRSGGAQGWIPGRPRSWYAYWRRSSGEQMIKAAPTGTYCDDCKAEYGNFDTKTRTWSFGEKCVPIATIITVSITIRAKGAQRAYCRYHKTQAETWPDGKGGFIHWSLEDQMKAARDAEAMVLNV